MIYDLTNTLHKERFKTRCNHLYKKGKMVELREVSPKRSLSQNSYLHLLLSYFALQAGEQMEYVKEYYYKRECNADIFAIKKHDTILDEEVEYLRSSADLSVDDMSLSIDRFKRWSAEVAGIYLPDSEKADEIAEAYNELERNKKWL